LQHPKIIGLVLATRPDCVSDEILDYLQELSERVYVMVEYGLESHKNETLNLINRGIRLTNRSGQLKRRPTGIFTRGLI
jgi:radical SAM superfamily enzyme